MTQTLDEQPTLGITGASSHADDILPNSKPPETVPPAAALLPVKDAEALNLLDTVTKGKQGERTDIVDNVNEVERPTGNSSDQALRRLRKDRPDLLAEVVSGKMSPNSAMATCVLCFFQGVYGVEVVDTGYVDSIGHDSIHCACRDIEGCLDRRGY